MIDCQPEGRHASDGADSQ